MIEIKGRYDKVLEELRKRNQKNNNYSLEEIQIIVKSILQIQGSYNESGETPIVKISNAFGLNVFKRKLTKYGVLAEFLPNGENKEANGTITVDSNMKLYKQRFFVAYELAYYLFYYIGSQSEEKMLPVNNRYITDDNKLYRFALEILMPEKKFIREYIRCMEEIVTDKYWTVDYLSKYFKVSKKVVRKRIRNLYE